MQNEYRVKLAAFHVTEVCTHCCPMCYASASNNHKKHAPINKVLQVSQALIDEGVEEVTLLGGDPAPYPYIVEVAKIFHDNGVTLSILSNTLAFNNEDLDDISRYIDAFEATIHSHVEKEHDNFCKVDGAYEKILTNLKYFSDKNKKIGIAVNVTPLTCDFLYDIVDLLVNQRGIRLQYVIIQRIIPMGRATSISNFSLTRDQVIKSLSEIQRTEESFNIEIIIEDPVPLCVLPENLRKYMSACKWGISKVSVNSNGDLSRCGADPRYSLGNILEKPLNEIWSNSQILKSFRSKAYLPGRCIVCSSLKQCGGGCSLSCEIEKDHGIDYLYSQYEETDRELHGNLRFERLGKQELSSVLQIEWANFSGYGHVFSVDSLKKWHKHNRDMFWVVKDKRNWIMGYAVIVPITKKLYSKICNGLYSSLLDFPERDVLHKNNSLYYHIEVIATIYQKEVAGLVPS